MNTIGRKLSVFAFVTVATTALTLGASTTFAVSNSHVHHHIQLMSSDYFPTSAPTHTHYHHMQVMSNGPNSASTNGFGSGALPP
jgi:hypothetical protein